MPRSTSPMLLLLAWTVCLLQGCAPTYGTAVRHFREVPSCCATLAELPTEPLAAGARRSFKLGDGSPAFVFDTGKSYFRAFVLPEGGYPFRVTLTSNLVGDYLKSARLFFPVLVTLDADHRVVRRTGPADFTVTQSGILEAMAEGGRLRPRLEGELAFTEANRAERYLVVLTTDELMGQGTRIPASGDVPMYLPGLDAAVKRNLVRVPHGPAGSLTIGISPLAPVPPSAPVAVKSPTAAVAAVSGKTPAVKEAAVAVAVTVRESGPVTVTNQEMTAAAKKSPPEAVQQLSVAGPEAAVTIHFASGKTIGSLEPGRTTLDGVRALFAAAGADLGQEQESGAPFAAGSVRLAPKSLYTPPGTSCRLYFERGVLVLVMDGAPSGLPATGKEFRRQFPAGMETGRTLSSYELQVPVTPCVILIAAFRTVGDTLDSAAYAHVCAVP